MQKEYISQLVNFGLRPRFPENLQHLRWAPVGLLWMNFGLRLRFPENLQHLSSGVGSSSALVGSGFVSLRIYSVSGGLRCGLLWVAVTFL